MDRASVCVIYLLSNIPDHSDLNNGPEFVAKAAQEWITAIGAMEPMGKRLPAPRCRQRKPSTRLNSTRTINGGRSSLLRVAFDR
jgi:hypothetical protein